MEAIWRVSLSYRLHGGDYGSAHHFTGPDAAEDALRFARAMRADPSWAPPGAVEVEVSDPDSIVPPRRLAAARR